MDIVIHLPRWLGPATLGFIGGVVLTLALGYFLIPRDSEDS